MTGGDDSVRYALAPRLRAPWIVSVPQPAARRRPVLSAPNSTSISIDSSPVRNRLAGDFHRHRVPFRIDRSFFERPAGAETSAIGASQALGCAAATATSVTAAGALSTAGGGSSCPDNTRMREISSRRTRTPSTLTDGVTHPVQLSRLALQRIERQAHRPSTWPVSTQFHAASRARDSDRPWRECQPCARRPSTCAATRFSSKTSACVGAIASPGRRASVGSFEQLGRLFA